MWVKGQGHKIPNDMNGRASLHGIYICNMIVLPLLVLKFKSLKVKVFVMYGRTNARTELTYRRTDRQIDE